MKKVFSSILRLTISYCKFVVIIFSSTLLKTSSNTDANVQYFNTSSHCFGFYSFSIGEQQNIRRNNICPKNSLKVDKKINLISLNINHEQNRRKV